MDLPIISDFIKKRQISGDWGDYWAVVSSELPIPSHYIINEELFVQLQALYRIFPSIAAKVLPHVHQHLSQEQMSFFKSKPLAENSVEILESEDQWDKMRSELLRECPLMIPFVANIIRVPHVQIKTSDTKIADKMIAMGRCQAIKLLSTTPMNENVTCGILSGEHIVLGRDDGCLSVSLMNEVQTSCPSFTATAQRQIVLNKRLEPQSSYYLQRAQWSIHSAAVYDIKMTVDRDHLLSCGGDGLISLWNKNTGVERERYRVHSGPVCRLAISQGGANPVFGAACMDGSARFYHIDRKESLRVFAHENCVNCIALNPEGALMATGCHGERCLTVWDLRTSHPVFKLGPLDSEPLFVDFIGDDTVAAISEKSTLLIWHMKGGRLLPWPSYVLDRQRCTFMTTFENYVALGSANGRMQLLQNYEISQSFDYGSGRIMDFRSQDRSPEWVALVV